jgi:hypothetical protein
MVMARQAGVGRIAATYGVHESSRLQRGEPHAWAEEFPEVLEHLGAPSAWEATG